MKFFKPSIVIKSFLILILPAWVGAAEFHVSKSWELSIALKEAEQNGSDDTIYLSEGIYSGKIFVYTGSNSLVLQAANSANSKQVILDGLNQNPVLNIVNSENNLSSVTIKGLTIRNALGNGLFISKFNNVAIKDCNINSNHSILNANYSLLPAPLKQCLNRRSYTTYDESSCLKANASINSCSMNYSYRDNENDCNSNLGVFITHTAGINIQHAINVKIINNNINDNSYCGVLLSDIQNIDILNNNIEKNGCFNQSLIAALTILKSFNYLNIKANNLSNNNSNCLIRIYGLDERGRYGSVRISNNIIGTNCGELVEGIYADGVIIERNLIKNNKTRPLFFFWEPFS